MRDRLDHVRDLATLPVSRRNDGKRQENKPGDEKINDEKHKYGSARAVRPPRAAISKELGEVQQHIARVVQEQDNEQGQWQ